MAEVNQRMLGYGNVRSAIRDLFEFGNQRAAEIGRENVYDYSLGNPSVPSPDCVKDAIIDLVENMDSVSLHGYTSAPGDAGVRQMIADDIKKRFGADVDSSLIYMTCGAAASLTISLNALTCSPEDEFIAIAPFFPEYRVFAETAGGKFVVVPADTEKFLINFDALEKAVNPHTKGVIINSPNNPSGVIFSPEIIKRLCSLLRERSEQYGHDIYLISDEPYRELVYDDGAVVPYLVNEYDAAIVCYSFSKSLSMPGERIGYVLVSPKMKDAGDVYAAIAGAGRALGYVCAPSMMQRVVSRCLGQTGDIEIYKTNRDLLYKSLTDMGYTCIYPDGAFYMFVKCPIPDALEFSMAARKYELLLVPSDSFGVDGFVRLAYCVSTDMIRRSLPAFRKLAEEFGLSK